MNSLAFAILTQSTCGDACWHAREEICRCSCGGRNHGILRTEDGTRPQRTSKHDGHFYELVAVIPGRAEGEAWNDVFERTRVEVQKVTNDRFPGVDPWAYGAYRQAKTMPVIDRKVSESQMKWPEVVAVPNAYRLIWAMPAGSRYLVRGDNYKSRWNDEQATKA